MMHQYLGMIVVTYVGFRLLFFTPDWHPIERWRSWRQGKGWHVCPHAQTVLVQCDTPPGEDLEYVVVCQACRQERVRLTEEDMRQAQEQEARWHWLRLILRWSVLPMVRETARFCTFVGSFVVASALVLWLCWGTIAKDVTQGFIELGAHLERMK
jgi:hypothetical protein